MELDVSRKNIMFLTWLNIFSIKQSGMRATVARLFSLRGGGGFYFAPSSALIRRFQVLNLLLFLCFFWSFLFFSPTEKGRITTSYFVNPAKYSTKMEQSGAGITLSLQHSSKLQLSSSTCPLNSVTRKVGEEEK